MALVLSAAGSGAQISDGWSLEADAIGMPG